jgi:prefoldin subunit 5
MPKEKVPPTERLTSSFKQLAVVSDELNSAADELGKTISTVEDALSTLKIGVSAWHKIAGGDDPRSGSYWRREIGYSKIGDNWCIAVRRVWGNEYDDEGPSDETWKFTDAPRWLCIEAVSKIPDLLDELIDRSQKTTANLKTKTAEAQELATVLTSLAAEVAQARK